MTPAFSPPGLIISAPASGTGKTTLTLGLARAFRDAGLQVQTFKSGPDYIDPAFHRAATGRPSYNLDTWAMRPGLIAGLLTQAQNADLILAEGSMGLHDGVALAGETGTGASADLALLLGWPVVLVLDVSGQAQTAAAMALGLATYRSGLPLAGVVLNRVASPRHERLIRLGMAQVGIPVLGALPRNQTVTMPERHLGLVLPDELPELDPLLTEAARFIAAHVDLDAIRAAARPSPFHAPEDPNPRPPGQRIALARDAAFAFVYPHLLHAWRAQGAEIISFSPLADQKVSDRFDVDPEGLRINPADTATFTSLASAMAGNRSKPDGEVGIAFSLDWNAKLGQFQRAVYLQAICDVAVLHGTRTRIGSDQAYVKRTPENRTIINGAGYYAFKSGMSNPMDTA